MSSGFPGSVITRRQPSAGVYVANGRTPPSTTTTAVRHWANYSLHPYPTTRVLMRIKGIICVKLLAACHMVSFEKIVIGGVPGWLSG